MPEKITKREQRIIKKQKKRRKYLKITIGVVVGILIVASCAWAVITYSPYLFGNKTPLADAGANQTADVGVQVLFNGTGKDPDGKIVLYEWDFDNDGIYEYSNKTTGSATHIYNETGVYTACLRVTDDKGATDTDEMCVYCVGTIIQIETNKGTIKIGLYDDNTPITTANFIELAESGFYDNLTIHRVAKDFVIQGGDPNGDGTGGSGKTIPWEDTGLKNIKYSIAMARSGNPNTAEGANTATSQFFINLKDNPSLDSYTYPFVVFGQVISGTEVVDAIGALYPTESPYDGHPTTDVIIVSVTISE